MEASTSSLGAEMREDPRLDGATDHAAAHQQSVDVDHAVIDNADDHGYQPMVFQPVGELDVTGDVGGALRPLPQLREAVPPGGQVELVRLPDELCDPREAQLVEWGDHGPHS